MDLVLQLIQASEDFRRILSGGRMCCGRAEGSERDGAKKMLHGVLPDTCRI
jgi:hypothetical protein